MSKASLIVGNSNWAIKDSSLLGYNINDSNIYSPFPFDVTRATPATRVDKAGLIVTDTEILSGELITNGDFSDGSTDWVLSGGSGGVSGGTLTFTRNAFGNAVYQQDVLVASSATSYIVEFDIIAISGGSMRWSLSPNTAAGPIIYTQSSIGKVSQLVPSDGTLLDFRFDTNSNGASVEIDNVSVIEVNRNNLARIDYLDSTKGVLLTEPQSTNTTIQSQAISNLAIFAGGVSTHTVTDNYTTSPNGGMNASRFQATRSSSDADSALIRTGNIATGDVTVSFYAKSLTGANQNVLSYIADAGVGEVFVVTSEWKRFVVSGNQATNNIALIGTRGGSGQFYNGGDENLDIAVWGIQTENLPYATSIIPTNGSTVTRNQDQVTNGGEVSTFNSEEGTLFAEIAALSDDGTNRNITISGGNSNYVRIYYSTTSSQITYLVVSNGSVAASVVANGVNQEDIRKIAVTWKLNEFKFYNNGFLLGTDTSGDTPIGLNVLKFSEPNGNNKFFGKTKQVQVFKKVLTDAELIKLTTI